MEEAPALPAQPQGRGCCQQVRVVMPRWDSTPLPDRCSSLQHRSPSLSRPATPASLLGAADVTARGEVTRQDEDAFTPSRLEEFRQWAGGRGGNPGTDSLRLPPSICLQVPVSRTYEEMGGVPHLFPALRERPLTCGFTPRGRGDWPSALSPRVVGGSRESGRGGGGSGLDRELDSKTAGTVHSGEITLDGYGVMGPASASSANHRAQITPRGISLLSSSARRLKLPRRQQRKEGEMMISPVVGQPGIVSLHGKEANDSHHHPHDPHLHPHSHEGLWQPPHQHLPCPEEEEDLQDRQQQNLQVPDPGCGHDGDQGQGHGAGVSGKHRQLPEVSAGSALCCDLRSKPQETSHLLNPALLPPDPVTSTGEGRWRRRRRTRAGGGPALPDPDDCWPLTHGAPHRSRHDNLPPHPPPAAATTTTASAATTTTAPAATTTTAPAATTTTAPAAATTTAPAAAAAAAAVDDSVVQADSKTGPEPAGLLQASAASTSAEPAAAGGDVSRARTAPTRRQNPAAADVSAGAAPEVPLCGPPCLAALHCATPDPEVRLAVVQLCLSHCPARRSLTLHCSTTTPRRLATLPHPLPAPGLWPGQVLQEQPGPPHAPGLQASSSPGCRQRRPCQACARFPQRRQKAVPEKRASRARPEGQLGQVAHPPLALRQPARRQQGQTIQGVTSPVCEVTLCPSNVQAAHRYSFGGHVVSSIEGESKKTW